jgi:hypothetical protein
MERNKGIAFRNQRVHGGSIECAVNQVDAWIGCGRAGQPLP